MDRHTPAPLTKPLFLSTDLLIDGDDHRVDVEWWTACVLLEVTWRREWIAREAPAAMCGRLQPVELTFSPESMAVPLLLGGTDTMAVPVQEPPRPSTAENMIR